MPQGLGPWPNALGQPCVHLLPPLGQQRGSGAELTPRCEMCPGIEKGVLVVFLPSGGLSALGGVSWAPLQSSQSLSPFIYDNLDPRWFSLESPAFKNYGRGCLIADQLRVSGKVIWGLKGPMRRFPWTDRRNRSGI